MVASTVPGDAAGTMKIRINGIHLAVQKGSILYQPQGSCDFYVASTAGVWKIVRWEDNTAPPAAAPALNAAVKRTTWFALKQLYVK